MCLEQYRQKAKNRRTDDPETYRRYAKQTRDKLRDDVLNAYGRVCACCGEDHREFLALDHINGGGVRHRAALGGNIAIYTHVRRQGYPEGFRLLCHNCNQSVGLYGYCPHGGLNDGNNDTPHAFA